MKRVLYIFLALALCLFVSCNLDTFLFGQKQEEKKEDSGSQTQSENAVKSSVLVMSFNNQEYSTKDGVFDYTFNIDNLNSISSNFKFTCYHFDKDGNQLSGSFTFSCEELQLFNVQDNSCTLNALNLKQMGTYIVKAKSSVSDLYDRYFIINAVANNPVLSVSYNIKSEYVNNKLVYEEQMLSGEITKYTKELTLVAGAVYEFIVKDSSENNYSIKNLTLLSTNNYIYFREQEGSDGEFVCMLSDNVTSNLTFQVGQTNVSVSVKVSLKDITNASLTYIDPNSLISEEILCFSANSENEKDKKYSYQVNLDTVIPDNEGQELMFCIDYEDWDEVSEEAYLNQNSFSVAINKDVNWYTRMNMYKVWDENNLFYVLFDGALRQFSIVPLKDTVFTSETHGVKNLHCYIYAKYKNDPKNVYRWKWRIMVGGVLEGLVLYTVTGETEDKLDTPIEIREGSDTGWIIKAKGVPSITANHTTIWYVAKGIAESNMQKYAWDSKGKLIEQILPIPATPNDEHANRWKVLTFLDGEQKASGYTFEDNYLFQNHYWDTTGMSEEQIQNLPKNLVVYNYFIDESSENGESTSVISYVNNGEDCALVVLNLETGVYNTVLMKNYNEAQVIIKGFCNDPVPAQIKTYENNSSVSKNLYTNYSENSDLQVQNSSGEYVQSYEDGYTGFNPSLSKGELGSFIDGDFRVFYLDVNKVLHIQLETSFSVTSASVNGDYTANSIFENYGNLYVNESRKKVDLYLSTRYANTPDSDDSKTTLLKKTCTKEESFIYITLNNQYLLKLKIVTFDNS